MNDISLVYGVQLSIMSMLIVFVLLYIISLILESFKVIFKDGKEQKKADVIVKPKVKTEAVIVSKKGITFEELESDQDMFTAAMVASMEASGENKESNYKIVSIKQL
ncbi:OadG family protein [Fusobacterium sp. IOR10]|uniref:OadG family protein n=1 Tax=Fusobacterium sp. IOR10 TaxID=2665157 RepID=UPI0013CFF64E|nr:OadG family protein [Fusobacterium sp. IOR10]